MSFDCVGRAAAQLFYTIELAVGCVSDAARYSKGASVAPASASLRITATEMPQVLSSKTLVHSCVTFIF